jgi:hypothetical protein
MYKYSFEKISMVGTKVMLNVERAPTTVDVEFMLVCVKEGREVICIVTPFL